MFKNVQSYAGISLLYVEDEADTRKQVSQVLAARGYQLTVAEDGQQGLDAFHKYTPDIVLTDIMMPQLNGLEMARAMRVTSPEIQIACMTAFSDTVYMIDAIDIGINQFVLKPVDLNRLFTALDRCQEMVEIRKRQKRLETENLRTKKNEAIGILAGGIAHDFNNLLQVILGYVSLARMNAEPGSKTESLLAVAERTSKTARELGARLLTLAKGDTAFIRPVHLGQVIKDGAYTGLGLAPSITLDVDMPDDLPLVMLDVDQIQQVVTNLVINAREAMPKGGTLRISAASVTLTPANDHDLPPGRYIHVLFEDTGTGIPPENLSKIFDPYFSTKEMGCQKGMGLSLSQCRSIIKRHHGQIRAESTPGKGTRIHIYLPVCHSRE